MQAGQPAPWSAPPPSPPAAGQVRPSAWWFGAAGAVAAIGVIVAVVIVVRGIVGWVDRIEDFDRADLPASLEVEITEEGGYSIYHETSYVLSDEPEVEVTSPSGDPVPLRRYHGSVTYATDDYEGEGLYTFEATETGVYEVTATGGGLDSGIAVGRGVGDGVVGPILTGVLLGFLSVVAGVVIAIVVGVSRGRNRRALAPVPAAAAWGAPGWGGPPGPPPGPYGGGGGYPPGYPPPPTPAAPAPPPPSPHPPQDAPPSPQAGGMVSPPSPQAGGMVSPPSPQAGGMVSPPSPQAGGMVSPPSQGVPPPVRDGGVGFSPSSAPRVPGDPARGGHPVAGPGDVRRVLGPRPGPASAPPGVARPITDPPSLRAPRDWSRGDVPLHWSPRR